MVCRSGSKGAVPSGEVVLSVWIAYSIPPDCVYSLNQIQRNCKFHMNEA